jgi:hypothetical protein
VVKSMTKAFLCLVCNHAIPTHEKAKAYFHEFLKSAAIVREWLASCWAALPLGKDTRYPLDIRLGRSQGLAKRCDKKLSVPLSENSLPSICIVLDVTTSQQEILAFGNSHVFTVSRWLSSVLCLP